MRRRHDQARAASPPRPPGSPRPSTAWTCTDLRIGRPLRSTDGRYVVGGWSATKFLAGRAEARHDEVVAVAQRLHQATAELPKPRFLDARTDVFAVADRKAWGEEDVPLDADLGGRLFDLLTDARKPLNLKPQVVHGDLFGNVLFAGNAPPAVIDFTAYWRPAEWAAAVVVVDAVAWGGADSGLFERWSHQPEWPQMLRARDAVPAGRARAAPVVNVTVLCGLGTSCSPGHDPALSGPFSTDETLRSIGLTRAS